MDLMDSDRGVDEAVIELFGDGKAGSKARCTPEA
jgi:hypothetical protein